MPSVAIFIVLSVLGIVNAAYLAYKHYAGRGGPLVCPLNHDCSVVTESRWSSYFGVRNELLGLAFYLIVFALAISTVAAPALYDSITPLLIFTTGAGLFFSLFLTALQTFVIRSYCFYCLLSALTTLLLFMNSFFF